MSSSNPSPSNFSPYQPPRDEQLQQYRPTPPGSAAASSGGATISPAPKHATQQPRSYPPTSAAAPAQLPSSSQRGQQQQQQQKLAAAEAFPPRSHADDDFADSYQAGAGVSSSNSRAFGGGATSSYNARPPSIAGIRDAGGGVDHVRVNKYETTLPVRVEILAALAYVLGPVTGVLLLVFETTNDYVRFHAWQSCLWFSAVLLAHFIFGLIWSFLGWLFFIGEILTAAIMAYKAYQDGQSLDRFHLPYIGAIAARWVDTE